MKKKELKSKIKLLESELTAIRKKYIFSASRADVADKEIERLRLMISAMKTDFAKALNEKTESANNERMQSADKLNLLLGKRIDNLKRIVSGMSELLHVVDERFPTKDELRWLRLSDVDKKFSFLFRLSIQAFKKKWSRKIV